MSSGSRGISRLGLKVNHYTDVLLSLLEIMPQR